MDMKFHHAVTNNLGIAIYAHDAQHYVQHLIPGIEASKQKRIAPYNGSIRGIPFWNCYHCGQPILDEEGSPIYNPENIATFEKVLRSEQGVLPQAALTSNIISQASDKLEEFVREVDNVTDQHINVIQPQIDALDTDNNMYWHIRSNISGLMSKLETLYSNNVLPVFAQYLSEDFFNDKQKYDIVESIHRELNYLHGFFHLGQKINQFNVEQIKSMDLKALVKFEVTRYYNITKRLLAALANNINVSKKTQATYVLLYPMCDSCFETIGYECEHPKCDFHSTDIDDFLTVKDYDNEEHLFCEGHAFTCYSCDKMFLKGEDGPTEVAGDEYCNDCYSERFTTCDECGATVNIEDTRHDERSGSDLCSNCYQEEKEEGIESNLTRDELVHAEKMPTYDFYPLDEKTLEKSVLPTVQLATQKRFSSVDQLREFLLKRLQSKEAKSAIISQLQKINNPEELLTLFTKQLEELKRLRQTYPGLSGFKFLPVDLKIENSKTHDGMVFVIYPSKTLLDYAESIQPGAKEAYHNYLSKKGHHMGALGYARVSVSDDKIIIDNLQTDLDRPAFTDEILAAGGQPLAWWLTAIKKFWAPYLLDTLRQFGLQIDKEVYLTSFKMQQKKWDRIPQRNQDVYDRLPHEMGFPEENVEVKPEDLLKSDYTMRRVAQAIDKASSVFFKFAISFTNIA